MNAAEFPNLSLALKLAQAGLPVFPCTEAPRLAYDKEGKPKKDKAPYTGAGFKDATTDLAQIQRWWAKWPGAVPGIPTGEASGLSVIDGDLDRDTGEAIGERQVADLGLMHPDAVKVRTQSGGIQLIYKHVEGARSGSHNVASNIDTRGSGGYIIAPGARMQSGATYRYEGRTLDQAIKAGNLPAYPLAAVQAALDAAAEAERDRKAKLSDQARVQINTVQSNTQASPAETMEIVRTLLAEAPNTLCREDWVKLAVSLRVEYGNALRDDFTSYSMRYSGPKPCTEADAAHVWQSSHSAHTVTGIGPALALLRAEAGPDLWKRTYRDVLSGRDNISSIHAMFDDVDQDKPKDEPKLSFQFVAVGDLEYRDPEFLIDGLIETDTLGMVFGDPGIGKSFMAVDLALSVATGTPFHGKDVKQGPVFYIAGEGHNGLTRRFHAWAKDRGVSLQGVHLYKSAGAAQFLDEASAMAVAQSVDHLAKSAGCPRLIVVDTLARNFGAGDENSTQDMGKFIAVMDALKMRYPDSVLLLVHHSGHAEKNRARGSMALKGALDFEFRLAAREGVAFQLACTKMKDAATPPAQSFMFKTVELKLGVESAVLEAVAEAETSQTRTKLSDQQRIGKAAFFAAACQSDAWTADGFQGLHRDDWRDEFLKQITGDNEDTKLRAFRRVADGLVSKGVLTHRDDVFNLVDLGDKMALRLAKNKAEDEAGQVRTDTDNPMLSGEFWADNNDCPDPSDLASDWRDF